MKKRQHSLVNNSEKGLTIVEILITTGIFSLLCLLFTMTFIMTNRATEKANSNMDIIQKTYVFYNSAKVNLGNALVDSVSSTSIEFYLPSSATTKEGAVYRTSISEMPAWDYGTRYAYIKAQGSVMLSRKDIGSSQWKEERKLVDLGKDSQIVFDSSCMPLLKISMTALKEDKGMKHPYSLNFFIRVNNFRT